MRVNASKCIGCGSCIEMCPVNAIYFGENGTAVINQDICINCGTCQGTCPVDAIDNN